MAITATLTGNRFWRWWQMKVLRDVDHEAVVAKVVAEARWSSRYAFMVVISAAISILGLLLPSSAVLIGAMLISPLMMPIIGLGFALATFDFEEIRTAAFALAAGSLIAIVLSAVFVALSPLQTVTTEIAIRTKPNLFDLLVAMLSAIAGGYALIRGRGETVVGVAIAIALMPPLAVVGFGIATANWTVFGGSLLLFFTNLIAMALTAAFMARLYGFGAHLSPTQTRLQGALIILGIVALAIPLGLALKQIAWETVASRQLRDAVLAPFPQGARISQIEIDYSHEPVQVRAAVLTPALASAADSKAKALAQRATGRTLDLHIDQIRVGTETGASEQAQIAAAQARDGRTRIDDAVRQRIGIIAGVEPGAVMLDSGFRTASVRPAPLPGASLATYRSLEQRAQQGATGWAVRFVPPAAALPSVSFDGDAPDDAGRRAVVTAIWAAQRTGLAVGVDGSGDRADVVEAAFADAGVEARRTGNGSGDVALSWLPPEAPETR
ncbi:DUF389 domain-containing protein [Allosphingosinicella indica]|uniref:Uncharacterized hydrophobic domain-containing protein n=1 Tax=Allosphingosinicella indica TaxID=941907 RepID=A0A1X7G0T4_9SPHN|nr:DUF389 domain-containing protein [Allosphingosinicella indica]SMF61866.1 uncharacterized hydrophobic domain-containing protein [Allosphingosinicella indica]